VARRRRCGNFLPDQGYCTPQGVVIYEYGAIEERKLAGNARRNHKLQFLKRHFFATTNFTVSHLELNPHLSCERLAPNHQIIKGWDFLNGCVTLPLSLMRMLHAHVTIQITKWCLMKAQHCWASLSLLSGPQMNEYSYPLNWKLIFDLQSEVIKN
jgi:hypothetical protein